MCAISHLIIGKPYFGGYTFIIPKVFPGVTLLAHNWYIETISTRNSGTLLNSSHYPLYVLRGLETEKRCLIDFSGRGPRWGTDECVIN